MRGGCRSCTDSQENQIEVVSTTSDIRSNIRWYEFC